MGILRKAAEPAGITNSSGQPEIVLEIDGLVISMAPPGTTPAAPPAAEANAGSPMAEADEPDDTHS